MGILALVVFGFLTDAGKDVTFQLTLGDEALALPDLTLPAKLSAIVFSLIALLAAVGALFAARQERAWWPYATVFGIFFVLAFLSWAVAGSYHQPRGPVAGLAAAGGAAGLRGDVRHPL